MLRVKLSLVVCLFISICGFSANWEQVSPGVWKTIVGVPDTYSLLSVNTKKPLTEALQKMPQTTLPLISTGIIAEVRDGKTYLQLPLVRDEKLYGFGLNFQNVQQRGNIFELHVDHYGKVDNGRTHAPVPFYISSEGYGVLINSSSYIKVYAGTGVRKDSPNMPKALDRNTDKNWMAMPYSDAVEVEIPTAGVEVFLFSGPETLDVIRRYNLFCGGGTLPPRWGLGFTQRLKTMATAEETMSVIDEFEKKEFPLDYIGLEPGWQTKAYPCTLEWDSVRFPKVETFIKKAMEKGVRLNLWTNPYISPDSKLYKPLLPYSGTHTVWCGTVPDFSMPEARKLFGDKLSKEHISKGVSGYKIDEVDGFDKWLWPDVAKFPSGITAEQMRQTYGLWVQRVTEDKFREINQRTYGLVRASNAGASSYPYVLYNDNYNHDEFITALINSGFCGVLWTPEVRASKSAEEWLRRFQTVVFSPMAIINGWASDTKPWMYPEVEKQIKYYADLRMQLMPYWYSTFAQYHYEGTPPFRAMALEKGFNAETKEQLLNADLEHNPYLSVIKKDVKDQYMAGDYLLVAPVFTGQKERTVIFPKGDWYDFYTGKFVGNSIVLKIKTNVDTIPVFVKDGGIIPMEEKRLHAPKNGEKVNLEIRHYGKDNGKYRLYDDDGETYNYEKGEYSWREIKVNRDSSGKLKGTISNPIKGKPNNIMQVSFRFMTSDN